MRSWFRRKSRPRLWASSSLQIRTIPGLRVDCGMLDLVSDKALATIPALLPADFALTKVQRAFESIADDSAFGARLITPITPLRAVSAATGEKPKGFLRLRESLLQKGSGQKTPGNKGLEKGF